jgi:hypothetical protein
MDRPVGLPARGVAPGVGAARVEAEGISAIDHVADGRVARYQEALRTLWDIFVFRSSAYSFSVLYSGVYFEASSKPLLWISRILVRIPVPSTCRGALCTPANPALLAPVAGAAIAGVTAAAAYIDAKYHITKDIQGIRGQKAAARALEKNCKLGLSVCLYRPLLTIPQLEAKASLSGINLKPKSAVSPPPKNASGRVTDAIPGPKPTRTPVAMANTSTNMASCPDNFLPCT